MTSAYPALQGGAVELTEISGSKRRVRLDNVVTATAQDVRKLFQIAAAAAVGRERASEIEIFIDALEDSDDASALGKLLQIDCLETRMDTGPQAMPRHEAD